MNKYNEYFGFKKEPFLSTLATKDLMQLPGSLAVEQRIKYVIEIGGIMVISGDVGAGKSTSLRWACSQHHPSQVLVLNIVANSGSSNELYKQLCWTMNLQVQSSSKSLLIKEFQSALKETVEQKKQKILVIIDEANLLRSDVFSELHTMTQFEFDSKNLFSMVLAGQTSMIDKLTYRTSHPLASRVIARTHLSALSRDQMADYLKHHQRVAGLNKNIFSEEAISAVQQGSSGLLRKANSLARGAMIACMIENDDSVSPEHVRIAATELI